MPTRGGLPSCAVSSCDDRDRLAFCPRACTMVGHFLDELLPVDQAVVVKKIMDKAGMVKPIDVYFLSSLKIRQLLTEILLPGPGPRSGTSPHLGALPSCFMFLARVREAQQLESTFNGPPPRLPSIAIPSVPSERRKGTNRPRRSTLADKTLRLAAANQGRFYL